MKFQKYSNLNPKVFASKSRIPKSGNGLFAKIFIEKGGLICTYGGKLIDNAEAKYLNPTYTAAVENGKGSKLIGDNIDGDMGHYANAVHPNSDSIIQNARFRFTSKKYLDNLRGRFDVIALKDINIDEEIIVKYGDGYWRTLDKWSSGELPNKSETTIRRDERALRRQNNYE